jgi:hypothetical protein
MTSSPEFTTIPKLSTFISLLFLNYEFNTVSEACDKEINLPRVVTDDRII